jgi:hypothetical protein
MMPFEPPTRDYAALAARIRAAAQPPLRLQVIGQQTSPDGAERYDLYLVRVPAGRSHADQVRVASPTGARRPRHPRGAGAG